MVVRRRGLRTVVRLSASRAGRPLPPGRLLVLVSAKETESTAVT
jgi:hypothetical protein